MIPCSLTLENFLSFGPEQILKFDLDRVFLLRGNNGVGKSSVFDAILFALFNGHRAGQKDLHELIHKGKDRGKVVFEFEQSGRLYRAQRTVQRKVDARTKQVRGQTDALLFEQIVADGGWKPIPGTQKQEGFKGWIDEHIGLRFETFTAAVLLMQNRAEQLVSNDAESAKQRVEVLSRVVGLDRFEALHHAADAKRKQTAAVSEVARLSRDRISPVTEADLANAEAAVTDLQARLDDAHREVDERTRHRDRAAEWARVSRRLADRTSAMEEAERLIGDREAIEQDGRRIRELDTVLPDAELCVAQEANCRGAAAETAALELRLRALGEEEGQVATEVVVLQDQHGTLTQREAELLADASTADVEKRALDDAVKLLQRLDRERGLFVRKHEALVGIRESLRTAEDRVKSTSEALTGAREEEGQMAAAAREAFAALTACRAREEEGGARLDRFRSVADDQTCRYCGLKLTEEHAADELRRLEGELAARVRARLEVDGQHRCAEAQANTTAERRQALDRVHREAIDERNRLFHEIDLASQSTEMHGTLCAEMHAELPEPYRTRVGQPGATEWSSSGYPADSDWTAIRAQQGSLVERVRQAAVSLRETRSSLQETATKMTSRRERAAALLAERGNVQRDLGEQQGRFRTAAARRDDALRRLTPQWAVAVAGATDTEVADWREELQRLRAAGAEGRWERLQQARATLAPLREERDQLRAEAEAFADADRQDPEQAARQVNDAESRRIELQRHRAEAEAAHAGLVTRQQQREAAATVALDADRASHLWTRLAEFLGRKRLQRHLLRQAEQGILEQANRLLDRLTGGHFTLRLQGGDTGDDDRALQLEATKASTGQTFALSFLSGSERFRVAVALALAIGQYGCRRQRPIESVIIDEGFGCLDRSNRQAMIEELGALREQLRCVVLVSHQEDFAEAFPDGYRFSLVDGATQVEACSG